MRATHYAIALAEKFSAFIDAVYVIDGDQSKTEVLHHAEKATLEKLRRKKINDVVQLLENASINYHTHILHGEAAPTILTFAEEHQVDCIVIGSRGLNQFQTFLLGSVSHKVAKRAKCPVLIVK